MNVVFYTNVSENIKVDKNITELIPLDGTLLDESSIVDPVMEIVDMESYLVLANYAYIPQFARYYFVTNVESVRDGLWRVSFHVDVLYTYRESIRQNSAVIARNQVDYDLQLNDGMFQTRQQPRIAQFPFPSGFDTWNFVLAIAGN